MKKVILTAVIASSLLFGNVLVYGADCFSIWEKAGGIVGISFDDIEDINKKPESYNNNDVKIMGVVKSTTNALIAKYYVVEDEQGNEVVVFADTLPVEGTTIAIKGEFKNDLTHKIITEYYIEESCREEVEF
jgi:hypothetical protein